MNNLVTIIVPAYNNEKNVRDTIESIINQSYKNLEIILINDGSTDKTLDILNDYKSKDSRIKVFSQLNSGPGEARNYGIREMSGDYATFVDADDIIGEKTIELLINSIKKQHVDVVRYNFFYSTNKNLKEKRGDFLDLDCCKFENEAIRKKLLPIFIKNELCSFVPLLLIKKEIIKKMRFDTNTNYMEDTLFYIDLLNKISSIFFIDEAEYYYFYTPQSAQNNSVFIYNYLKSLNYVYHRLNDIIKENDIECAYNCKLLNLKWLNTIIDYLTMLLRSDCEIKFEDFKNEISKLNFDKNIDFRMLPIKKYNKISIKLLVYNKLKLLYIFTKFRNFLKKILG